MSEPREPGWRWYQRVFWMGWGVDLRLRRSYVTLVWRPEWRLFWSPNATPWHEKAQIFLGGRR